MFVILCATLMLTGVGEGLVAGPVETVLEELEFSEGPVWVPGTGLLFSDIPADTIYRADRTVFRNPSGNSNGLAVDAEGRLIACEHGNRRVTRTEQNGDIVVLADKYLGRKLNSPNDLTIRSDGTIFFSDPPYGVEKSDRELPFAGVYCIAPDGEIRLLSVYFKYPNGLAFSPDEKTLYVADSGAGFIQSFEVAEDGSFGSTRLFAQDVGPDGMKTDVQGCLWVAAKDGVRVYAPSGELLQGIPLLHQPTNCAFGDDDRMTLYVTARPGVYKLRTAVKGR